MSYIVHVLFCLPLQNGNFLFKQLDIVILSTKDLPYQVFIPFMGGWAMD